MEDWGYINFFDKKKVNRFNWRFLLVNPHISNCISTGRTRHSLIVDNNNNIVITKNNDFPVLGWVWGGGCGDAVEDKVSVIQDE